MLAVPNAFFAKLGTSLTKQAALGADALAELANAEARDGWEFYRVDTFTTYKKGCWSSLTGGQEVESQLTCYVATFRRPKS